MSAAMVSAPANSGMRRLLVRLWEGSALPVVLVVAAILAFWYLIAIHMNAPWQERLNDRADIEVGFFEFVDQTWSQKKPLLPVPHQIGAEIWKATVETDITSRRSLAYHSWITLSSTLLGFAFGTALGIGLAIIIIHNDASNRSLMPWIIASQTVPILAIAPMIVVGLGAVGITGLVPKALISMYLSFFPVVVGMVKGLRSPKAIELDLMRTYYASPGQVFTLLRWPASVPFLFASMRVGIAISLIGAVVAELSNAAGGGLGVRLLTGSYNGQTIQIWAALLLAAALAAALVFVVELAERMINAMMGGQAMSVALTNLQRAVIALAGIAAAFGFATALVLGGSIVYSGFLLLGAATIFRLWRLRLSFWIDGALALAGAVILLQSLGGFEDIAPAYVWLTLVAVWMFAWLFIEQLSIALTAGKLAEKPLGLVIPVVFGLMLLFVWEIGTRGAEVPQVLLPPPSAIWLRLIDSVPILHADFVQTFVKSVLSGYVMGCGGGFAVAILVDRSPFLRRGLLPIGNFVSALPIIGIAPIMVMWFGFDWPSKAAVVVAVTFFPMLVNTVAGLNESSQIERDLMRTYAANYWQTLFRLRLPAAAPFIFNALKINSTLALIGAIVAEFFGTPIVGMGFRISTEVGKLNIDLVWAEIAVAAVAGSAFYGIIALIERAVTFWHPSVRKGRA